MESSTNRIRRITFAVGPCKFVAHIDNKKSGSKAPYEAARDPHIDATNVQTPKRETYKTEEA